MPAGRSLSRPCTYHAGHIPGFQNTEARPPPTTVSDVRAALTVTAPLTRVPTGPPAGRCHYRHNGGQPLPDPTCTPGALNPDVTQATLSTTICRKGGYASGLRPPSAVTDREKRANTAAWLHRLPARRRIRPSAIRRCCVTSLFFSLVGRQR